MPAGASRSNSKVLDSKGRLKPIQDRYQALIDGTLPLEELTDEELLRGKLMAKDGTFKGRNPTMIPRSMHTAVVKELVKRSERKLLEDLDDSYQALREVRDSPRAQAAARVAASIYLIERVSGKIPDKQEVEVTTKKFEELAEGGALIMDLEDVDIIDAEVVKEIEPPKAPVKRRGGRKAAS